MNSIGVDIVSIDRIERWIDDNTILNRVFTEKEISSCLKNRGVHRHLAGRFAAKEAAMKALGTGWGDGIEWKDIEIVNDSNGRPLLNFYGNAVKLTDKKNPSLSISYTPEFAVAIVVISD